MFPSAPKVEVFAPASLRAGREAVIEVVATAEDATKVDFIEVRLRGQQGWRIGSGDSAVVERLTDPELVARVMGPGRLPAGTSRFRARFALPDRMPPSHELAPAWSRVELRVHVSIPWWLDGRYRFELPVRIPPPAEVVRRPIAATSRRADASADGPRLELSLASTRLVAGETVVGSCAVFHLDDRKPRTVELAMVPSFELYRRGRVRERRGDSLVVAVEIPAGSAGTSVPFQFKLPANITPSFAATTHALAWWLVAKTGSLFGKKLELALPLEIVDASAAVTTTSLAATPRLSDERVTAAFERFARDRGWRAAADDEREHPALERDAGDATLHLGHAYRGKDGTFLVARLALPSLGLGLSCTPSTALREMLSRDIEIDLAAWDRAHHVVARSTAQAVPFLVASVPFVMKAMQVLGPLVRWTDDELVFERAVVGVDLPDLARSEQALDELAAALATVSAEPPPELVVDLDAWRTLARRLHGRLTVGDLSIEGRLDQAPVELGLQWDALGRPHAVRAHVGHAASASGLLRELELVLPRPAEDAASAPGAATIADRLAAWPDDFADLHIADGVASASWQLAGDVADAARVDELVRALRAVLAALDPGTGPYR